MPKVGYFPCSQDPPNGANISRVLNESLVEAQVAEETGYDGCFFSEHHQQSDCYVPNVLMMAGMAGVRTRRINVGTCVVLLPLQHPVHVAEDAAIVDQVTEGRMILSVGVGYQQVDFDAFDVPIGDRATRTEEGIEIIRKAWSQDRISFSGKHYKLTDVRVRPQPYKNRAAPIWLAGWTNPGVRRAGRIADGWITSPLEHVQVIKRFGEMYRDSCRKHGRKPTLVLMRDVLIADSWDAARRESGPLMYTHKFYFRNHGYAEDEATRKAKSEDDWAFDLAAPNRFIAGSPRDCLEQLKMWQQEVQFDYLILRMRHPGGPDHAQTVKNIRLFGEKVIPQL